MKKAYGILATPSDKEKCSFWITLNEVPQSYDSEESAKKDLNSLVRDKDEWFWHCDFKIALFSSYPKIK